MTNRLWNKIYNIIFMKEYAQKDYEKYLSLRALVIGIFAAQANSSENGIWKEYIVAGGTIWFVDKANRKDDSDYKYWVTINLIFVKVLIIKWNEWFCIRTFFCARPCKEISEESIIGMRWK